MACETGISPIDLERCHPDMLHTVLAYVNWRAERQAKANAKRGR